MKLSLPQRQRYGKLKVEVKFELKALKQLILYLPNDPRGEIKAI